MPLQWGNKVEGSPLTTQPKNKYPDKKSRDGKKLRQKPKQAKNYKAWEHIHSQIEIFIYQKL